MRCYTCDKADLVHEVKDIEHVYRGETLVIPSVKGDHCPACGDVVLGDAEGDRVSNAMLEFNQKVNASIASEIARTRKKLKLTQAGANRLFGGGVNAFSRYEKGKVLPPQSLVHLFRLLDRHPELLEEVKNPPHATVPHGDDLAYA